MKKLKFKVGDKVIFKGSKVEIAEILLSVHPEIPYRILFTSGSTYWASEKSLKPVKKPKYKHLQKQIDRLKKEVEGLKRSREHKITWEPRIVTQLTDELNDTSIRAEQPTEFKKGDIAVVLEDSCLNLSPGQAVKIVGDQYIDNVVYHCQSLIDPDEVYKMYETELKHINDFK